MTARTFLTLTDPDDGTPVLVDPRRIIAILEATAKREVWPMVNGPSLEVWGPDARTRVFLDSGLMVEVSESVAEVRAGAEHG